MRWLAVYAAGWVLVYLFSGWGDDHRLPENRTPRPGKLFFATAWPVLLVALGWGMIEDEVVDEVIITFHLRPPWAYRLAWGVVYLVGLVILVRWLSQWGTEGDEVFSPSGVITPGVLGSTSFTTTFSGREKSYEASQCQTPVDRDGDPRVRGISPGKDEGVPRSSSGRRPHDEVGAGRDSDRGRPGVPQALDSRGDQSYALARRHPSDVWSVFHQPQRSEVGSGGRHRIADGGPPIEVSPTEESKT